MEERNNDRIKEFLRKFFIFEFEKVTEKYEMEILKNILFPLKAEVSFINI